MNADIVMLFVASILPTLVILLWLNRRGRPWTPVLLALGLGGLSSFPALYLEQGLTSKPWAISNVATLLVFTMIVAGVVEECCKYAAFWIGPGRWGWVREEYDGVLFMGALSLGFATVENVGYVMNHGMATAAVRAFTAIPLHVICGIAMGSYLGLAHVREKAGWSGENLGVTGLGVAIIIHGVYDLFAFLPSSAPATFCLVLVLLFTGAACVRHAGVARCRSASFGGVSMPVPPPLYLRGMRVPIMPTSRRPWISGLLGLVPGAGQFYNGEPSKGWTFLVIGLSNIGLYALTRFFVDQPREAIGWLMSLGFVIQVKPDELVAAIEQKSFMPAVLLVMMGVWMIVGAVEAFLAARRRWYTPKQHAMRRSFVPHGVGSSYLAHLLVVVFVVFAPIIAAAGGLGKDGGKAAGKQGGEAGERQSEQEKKASGNPEGQNWNLTWVGAPVRIQGWNPGTEGQGDGKGEAKPEQRPAPTSTPPAQPRAPEAARKQASARPTETARKPQKAQQGSRTAKEQSAAKTPSQQTPTSPYSNGPSVVVPRQPQQRSQVATQHPPAGNGSMGRGQGSVASQPSPPRRQGRPDGLSEGVSKSYNDYLSYKVREAGISDFYFRHVSPYTWTVVKYKIGADGRLVDARVVKTNGTEEEAARVVVVINDCAPFLPLPENANAITVTELFWSGGYRQFEPGTLEERLARLPDGRFIDVE